MFVTDANGTFGMTVDIVRHLQLGGHLPNMVIIGVGYPVGRLSDTVRTRARDFTPTVWPLRGDDGTEVATGGADKFLAFLERELIPALDARLPRATRRILYGHSLGGLFAVHAALTGTNLFTDFLVASPSTWWDDYSILRQISCAAERPKLPGQFVVSVGAEETSEGRLSAAMILPSRFRPALIDPPRDMAADAETLAAALVALVEAPSQVRFRRILDEHHVSVPAIAISHGLRVLFDAPGAASLAGPATP